MPWPSDKSWFNVNLYCKTDVTDVGIVVLNHRAPIYSSVKQTSYIFLPSFAQNAAHCGTVEPRK